MGGRREPEPFRETRLRPRSRDTGCLLRTETAASSKAVWISRPPALLRDGKSTGHVDAINDSQARFVVTGPFLNERDDSFSFGTHVQDTNPAKRLT
jgi:hypothetical protein